MLDKGVQSLTMQTIGLLGATTQKVTLIGSLMEALGYGEEHLDIGRGTSGYRLHITVIW